MTTVLSAFAKVRNHSHLAFVRDSSSPANNRSRSDSALVHARTYVRGNSSSLSHQTTACAKLSASRERVSPCSSPLAVLFLVQQIVCQAKQQQQQGNHYSPLQDRDRMDSFSQETLLAMRSSSRSPNKRSGGGADGDEERRAAQRVITTGVVESADNRPHVVTLETPFKRFRVNTLISPSKNGSALDALAFRRRGFQSLAADRFLPTIKSIATHVASASDRIDTEDSSSRQSWQQNSQQEELKCSPTDVAAFCGSQLACSETLETQMDALDVGSFVSWRPPFAERKAAATAQSTPLRRHRRKPRIHISEDLSLHDASGNETQLVSSEDEPEADDDDAEPELPVRPVVAHFPLDSGCACSDHDSYDVFERRWQAYSPPPRPGFDPTTCCADSDYGDGSNDGA